MLDKPRLAAFDMGRSSMISDVQSVLSASEVTALAPIYRYTTPTSSEKAARLDGSISIDQKNEFN